MHTYTKLRTGNWGIRSTVAIATGDRVTVTKRSGETKVEIVGTIVWTGNGVWLAAIATSSRPRQASPVGDWRGTECRTGGNCSSVGSGRSCGGLDCDGY